MGLVSYYSLYSGYYYKYNFNSHIVSDVMSKGDRPRPFSVDKKTFEENFDKIFKKDKEKNDQKKEGTTKTSSR